MKNSHTILLIFFACTLSSQSYFSEKGQTSHGLNLQYAPNQIIDQATIQYIISPYGRLDISPAISYGGNPTTATVFSAGMGLDYYVLKQSQSMPLSFSIGGRYSYFRNSSVGSTVSSHFGTTQGRVYHKIQNENVSIVPIIGYSHTFNLEDSGFNGGAVEIAAAFGLELNNENIATLTPAVQFPEGDTQFIIGLGYIFGRSALIEE